MIERIHPRRHHRAHRRDERPMRLILRALGDPAPQRFLFRSRQRLVRFRRRHQLVWIRAEDAHDRVALLRLAGDDRPHAVLFRECPLAGVEPPVGFAMIRVGAVTVIALVRKNRPHVAVEGHGLIRAGRVDRDERSEGVREQGPPRNRTMLDTAGRSGGWNHFGGWEGHNGKAGLGIQVRTSCEVRRLDPGDPKLFF